jgi:hypothetical protein
MRCCCGSTVMQMCACGSSTCMHAQQALPCLLVILRHAAKAACYKSPQLKQQLALRPHSEQHDMVAVSSDVVSAVCSVPRHCVSVPQCHEPW